MSWSLSEITQMTAVLLPISYLSLSFLSHYPHLISLPHQVFPRWSCWTQRGTWSRDRAAWKCWTTRSASSFPGTLDLCSSWASPTPCSCTKGPASSCLWVSGPPCVVRLHVGLQCGAGCLWMKWHAERSIVKKVHKPAGSVLVFFFFFRNSIKIWSRCREAKRLLWS